MMANDRIVIVVSLQSTHGRVPSNPPHHNTFVWVSWDITPIGEFLSGKATTDIKGECAN